MSSIPFERYDEEFDSLANQVTSCLSKLRDPPSASGSGDLPPTAESDLRMASNLLTQCDDLLKQMSVEARDVPDASAKRDLLAKVRTCKARLANLRDDYDASRSNVERSSLGLPSSGGDALNGKGGAARERLLATTDQISSQNETLDNARRVMAETEDVALEITTELGRNRETIQSAHGRVREVSGLTNRARRIVQSMSRREVQQKIVLYSVSFAILVVLIIIIYNMGR